MPVKASLAILVDVAGQPAVGKADVSAQLTIADLPGAARLLVCLARVLADVSQRSPEKADRQDGAHTLTQLSLCHPHGVSPVRRSRPHASRARSRPRISRAARGSRCCAGSRYLP